MNDDDDFEDLEVTRADNLEYQLNPVCSNVWYISSS